MIFTVTAGHSDREPGNTWGGVREADLMDELGHLVAMKLRQAGHTVHEDGGRGENWPLAEAIRLIQRADLAVELHTNANANRSASGVEVVSLPARRDEAQALALAIGGVLQIPVRRDDGWFSAEQLQRERGFMPGFCRHGGLIVETFFQSNPAELAVYRERYWLVAGAIARTMVASVRAMA